MRRTLIRPNLSALLSLLSLAILLAAPEARAESRTIVVDAGHGGYDRGGVPYQRIGEKALTLDVAQRLKRVLESSGFRVVMTRNSDVFIPLGQRVSIANSYRGSTFVSIHFNSANRSGANGIETYYYRGDSSTLAANIHRNVVAVTPTENRGIRRRGYFVLRRTSVRGVLVECGFLTNPTEGRNALQASYRQKLAEAIARGIQGFRAPISRPLTPGSTRSSEVLPQRLSGPDFVQAAPRARSSKRKKSSKSSRNKGSSKKKKSSGSSKKKKKSS